MTNDAAASETDPNSQAPNVEKPNGKEKLLIVGIGASAGGIQALKVFFTEVPGDSGMAYVVILHMSPEHESKLAEILQVTSRIPVTQVRQRVKVEPNQVYVIPPSHNLAMTDGHLDLKSMIGAEERRSPVDLFFRTLAETNEDRAVSVILSGTGANGSMGMKRIKECGGVAFAQDPNEAEYKDMPRNAIATGVVDYVLPVSEIPAKIISYRDHIHSFQQLEAEVSHTDEQALLDIFTQLRVRTGHDFANYKRATILRRIERRIGLREVPGLQKYAQYLREQPEEVQALMKDLLISVTNFFRDPEAVEALCSRIIPRIFEKKSPSDSVRVWIAGCATGEEAYSLAMVFAEYMGEINWARNLQVFATDIDEQAIQIARAGYYKNSDVADVSPSRLRRFFNREAEGYRVRRELRESILFAVHNVISDPPFSHLDLISCRNLLIYLNRVAQKRVLEVVHFALNPSGHLFLGASESIEGSSDFFTVVDKDQHIYRRRSAPPRALPIPDVPFKPSLTPLAPQERTPEETRARERLSYADLHQRLLEQYAAPSVVVNEDYDIVHLSDRAGQFLQLIGGEPSQNLLKLAREGLRLELRTALYQAVHENHNVEAKGVRVATDQGVKTLNIVVRPALRKDESNTGFILVIFDEADEKSSEASATLVAPADEPLSHRLEEELVHVKTQLRSTVEQYEIQQEESRASNEELQAMNEELRSTAEELETSKEELQAVNEELTTVNQELKIKIDELSQANNNFQNLMNSTNIGTIFLDRSLRVRQFTPTARETFNLISSDLGRPLMDIRSKFKFDDLMSKMETVMSRLETVEQQVTTADDRSYMMRLSPYRTLDDKIDGLVMTLVDVTERARVQEIVRRAGEELERKVKERTAELAESNEALREEVEERRRTENERLKLLEQLVNAQEDERRRLARDLHDQLGQQLTSLRMKVDSLMESKKGRAPATIDEIQAIIRKMDADVDFLAWEVRPIALDELGLAVVLSNYTKQWSEHFNIAAEFHSQGLDDDRLAPEIESNLYRIAQEALNNSAKHSQCTQADVILERRDHHAVLIIEDNGKGFDRYGDGHGTRVMGLLGMRERALLIGGSFEIESAPQKGTTVFVRVPIAAAARKAHE